MKNIKIVIGANYGDEGKGLATNFFAKQAKENKEKTVVVLHNGGFQRGHTVIHNNIRHVFHCFSSGTFQNTTTYYASSFILNPMFFKNEYEQLKAYGYEPKVMVNPNCRISTLYDMMINQIIEEHRDKERHGSCGFGVWETVVRDRIYPFTIQDLLNSKNKEDLITSFLFMIRENYVFNRLEELGLEMIPVKKVQQIFNNDLVAKYIEDLLFMLNYIEPQETTIIDTFDTIIFEGSQGLLLDKKYALKVENSTPSNTDLTNPSNIIKELKMLGYLEETDIETHYITRTYLTRHGAGDFATECNKEDINKDMFDKTNIHNDYQGTLRYGYIDINELQERIKNDSKLIPQNRCFLFVTHLNETNNMFYSRDKKMVPITEVKNIKYISKTETKVEEI